MVVRGTLIYGLKVTDQHAIKQIYGKPGTEGSLELHVHCVNVTDTIYQLSGRRR